MRRSKKDFEENRDALTAEAGCDGGAPGEKNGKKMKSEALSWVIDIAVAVLIAVVISRFAVPTIVQEHSMDDTLHNNDYLVLWKAQYMFGGEPEYGDIIVFKSDLVDERSGKNKNLIKRVIGVPGDRIEITGGAVYKNGQMLYEPYIRDGYTNSEMAEVTVPEGKLFAMGDNRLVSLDSRSPEVGFIDEDRVIGKAVFRLFPFSDFGKIYKNFPDDQE